LDSFNTPTLKKRFAVMLYEGMLLFGVLFIADWLFSTLLQQRHALHFRNAGQVWLFVVLAVYFGWFWSHGGQTLAMKTWRIKLVSKTGLPVTFWRSILRYVFAWGWFLPGLALAWAIGAKGWAMVLIPFANMLIWALAAYTDPQRNFLHDRLAGTRLVQLPASAK
jgi:uncharacterized RDD family membrane protein YckC